MENIYSAVGVDIGTTSVKSVICEIASASVKVYASATCTSVSESPLSSQENANGEQSVLQIISAFLNSIKQLIEQRQSSETARTKIQRLAVCGQMHGVILWSRDASLQFSNDGSWKLEGSAISNLITWQDSRCSDDFISSLPPSHSPLHPGFGCATLFWLLKYQPDQLARYDCAGTIMDFLIALLCRLESPVMSDQNAFGWGYYLCQENQWQSQLLKEAGFPIHLLPQVLPAGTMVGHTKFDLWGLVPSGTEVYVATGDAQSSILSTRLKHHQAVLNFGTSCQMSVMNQMSATAPTATSPHTCLWPFSSEGQLQVAASMNGGNVLEALVTSLTKLMCQCGGDVSESTVWSKLTSINPTNLHDYDKSLTINPTLYKERASPLFSGASITGLKPSNIDLETLYVCTCIGLVRNVEAMFPMSCLIGCGVSEIVCTGSLFSTHPIFPNVVKYVYRDMSISFVRDVNAAYGSVLFTVPTPKLVGSR